MVFPWSQMKIEDLRLAAVDTMFVDSYVEALKRFRDQTIERLLGALDGIGYEWQREEQRLRSLGADEEVIGDLCADFSVTASQVEQETRNILAVGMYHLFERQVTVFSRRAVRLRRGDPKGIRGLKGARKARAPLGRVVCCTPRFLGGDERAVLEPEARHSRFAGPGRDRARCVAPGRWPSDEETLSRQVLNPEDYGGLVCFARLSPAAIARSIRRRPRSPAGSH